MAIEIQLVINAYTPNCLIISKIQDIITDNDFKVFDVTVLFLRAYSEI